jgi:two-component system OmpR family sensor kinase
MNRLWVRISLTYMVVMIFIIMLPLIISISYQTFRVDPNDQPTVQLPFVDQASQVPTPVNGIQEISGWQLIRNIFRFMLGLAFIGSVVGVLVSRSLTAPLNNLVRAAQDIGAQDLSRRVDVKGTEEIRAVAQAFNEMAEKLEQAERNRSNLLADVAHELRTPLTVIQGNLRAILDDVYELDKTEIARLYDQTRNLTRLVNDLRELAQAEAHQLPLSILKVDVETWVQETIAVFQPIAEADEINLELEILEEIPSIQADKARLTQCLNNLLINAVKHTPARGLVKVIVSAPDRSVLLCVIDNGEGIAPEHLDYVFDRFYRTDIARSRDSGGTGLGLAISRAIVEAHGGKLTVASEGLHKGSTFSVSLPLASCI